MFKIIWETLLVEIWPTITRYKSSMQFYQWYCCCHHLKAPPETSLPTYETRSHYIPECINTHTNKLLVNVIHLNYKRYVKICDVS
jgi:hypothetical protein